jgi:hypothetical protein
MPRIPSLETTRYWDKFLHLARDCMRDLFDYAHYWDQLSSEHRYSLLQSCGLIKTAIPHLQGGRERGELTRRQLRELTVLERRYSEAVKLLELLRRRDQELHAKERDHE